MGSGYNLRLNSKLRALGIDLPVGSKLKRTHDRTNPTAAKWLMTDGKGAALGIKSRLPMIEVLQAPVITFTVDDQGVTWIGIPDEG